MNWQQLLFDLIAKFAPLLIQSAISAIQRAMEDIPPDLRDDYASRVADAVTVVERRHPNLTGTAKKKRVDAIVKQIELDWGLDVPAVSRDTIIQNTVRRVRG